MGICVWSLLSRTYGIALPYHITMILFLFLLYSFSKFIVYNLCQVPSDSIGWHYFMFLRYPKFKFSFFCCNYQIIKKRNLTFDKFHDIVPYRHLRPHNFTHNYFNIYFLIDFEFYSIFKPSIRISAHHIFYKC